MLVSEYMTPDPLVAFRRESVSDITDLLRKNRVHQVPVVDESNRLVGIITHRDIEVATGSSTSGSAPILVEDIMTREVITVQPTTTLREAVRILSCERFGTLPVVIGHRVVGILSSRDLLRHFMDMLPASSDPSSGGGAERPNDSVAAP